MAPLDRARFDLTPLNVSLQPQKAAVKGGDGFLSRIKSLGVAAGDRLSFSFRRDVGVANRPVSVNAAQPHSHLKPGKAANLLPPATITKVSSNTPNLQKIKQEVEHYDDIVQKGNCLLNVTYTHLNNDWKPLHEGDEAYEKLNTKLTEMGFNKLSEGGYMHAETGTRLVPLKNKNELTIYIQGLGTPQLPGFKARAGQIIKEHLGGIPEAAKKCHELGKCLEELKGGSLSLSVVGHSHGGGLAQVVGLTAGIKTVCFNNRYPSKAIRNGLISEEACQRNQDVVTNYHKEGDFLTGTRAVNRLAAAFGVTTFLGNTFSLSAVKKGAIAIHNETGWIDPS